MPVARRVGRPPACSAPWRNWSAPTARVFELGLRSLALWPRLLSLLERPVQFSQDGSLLLAHRGDEGAAQRVVELLERKAPPGYAPQALAAAALRELEPAVQGPAHAWLLPCEGRIHTVQAMDAMAAVQGVKWHWAQRVDACRARRRCM